ncbi:MAG: PQQ-like beta-propeller repeat protein [Planctomycetales bacterium]|nr:PQQ-like beta-propeller repeat protein [Planctomycetales bacterium]
MRTFPSLGLLVISLNLSARAADWPQYRGPQRNDVSVETGLLQDWPAGGPALVWTYKNAGIGYSGPAIVGDRLFTIGGRGDTEYLIALDLNSVKDGAVSEAWAASVGKLFDFKTNSWSAGPSATPTVDGELVFALGGNGDLVCVQAADGKERWRKNLPSELDAQVNPIGGGPKNLGWGFTWSPLVDGDQLICVPGGPKGTVAALDKTTGVLLWRSAEVTDQAAYTSPMVAEIDGVRQYVVLTNQGMIGVAAKSGRVLWNYRRKPAFSTEVVNSPIIHGSFVYTTVGAGQGCDLLRIERDGDKFQAESVYSNKNMTNHHANVALVGEHVFGFSEGKGWMCQAFQTGEIVWMEKSKLRAGSMTCADGRMYCYSEDDGTVALIESSTSGWKESGRFRIPERSTSRKPSGRIWTPPVVSGGRLFLRDQELLFCYDVKARE